MRDEAHPALHDPPSRPHGREDHYVPDGWDERGRGICPCGEAVRWSARRDLWVPDRSLRVLVLTKHEAALLSSIVLPAGSLGVEISEQLTLQEDP